MSDYTPTTEEVKELWCTPMTESAAISQEAHWEAEDQFDRWLAEVERAAAEKAWWEACLRIADGENHLDIAHVYQKQNPHLAAALGLTAGQKGENDE